MKDFKELVQKRRSIRNFKDEELKAEDLQTILRAGLMAPTGKSVRGWHFVVVDNNLPYSAFWSANSRGMA
jgi:nitroreductase